MKKRPVDFLEHEICETCVYYRNNVEDACMCDASEMFGVLMRPNEWCPEWKSGAVIKRASEGGGNG